MLKIGETLVPSGVVLGPMAGVTDLPFRITCKEYGCGMVYSEMVSTKALKFQDQKTLKLLETLPEEQPLAVQIFGSDPEIMAEGAKKIEAMGIAQVIDLNMGCPAPKIVQNGDGSALMKNPALAAEIIKAVCGAVKLPVTVKFRKGWDCDSVNAVSFAEMAERSGAAAIAVHGRTRSQFYSGTADWDLIRRVKQAVGIPVIGNGDVFDFEDIEKMRSQTGCDGVMIARGALGNPFIFSGTKPERRQVIETALRHLGRMIACKGEYIGVREARKHMSWYVKGMHGAARLKDLINRAESQEELNQIMQSAI